MNDLNTELKPLVDLLESYGPAKTSAQQALVVLELRKLAEAVKVVEGSLANLLFIRDLEG